MAEDAAYHEGERAIQARYGLSERMAQIGAKVIRPLMPDQHREFFAQLPLIFLGAQDAQGRPWASLRYGQPGFVTSPDPRRLRIQAAALPHDPLADLAPGQDIAVLGLEFETRRRNRASARLVAVSSEGLELEVKQSFGNCPKYIQARRHRFVTADPGLEAKNSFVMNRLDATAQALVEASDSFLIASLHQDGSGAPNRGMDVSHRGGKPGFVRVAEGRTLSFPDFSGNMFFNTLGNLLLDPRAGLLFIDYLSGGLLFLTGRAELIWSGPELESFAGAERLLHFELEEARYVPAALPLRWDFESYSPALQGTGTWAATRPISAFKE